MLLSPMWLSPMRRNHREIDRGSGISIKNRTIGDLRKNE